MSSKFQSNRTITTVTLVLSKSAPHQCLLISAHVGVTKQVEEYFVFEIVDTFINSILLSGVAVFSVGLA